MSVSHPKQILHEKPEHKDPASRRQFKVGDDVRYCPQAKLVFLDTTSYDGKCPYCGFQIASSTSIPSLLKEKPSLPPSAPSTAPIVIMGLFSVLILCVGAIFVLNGINNPPRPTPFPTAIIVAETPTPYPTSTSIPTNTKEPIPTNTEEPIPTNTQGPTSPVIDLIDLAPAIICDGRRYNVPIHFHDADGDAQDIFWELVYSKKSTILYSTRRNLEIGSSAQIKGAIFNDWIEWNKARDEVKIRVIITDSTGLSGWKEFEFSCSK